MDDETDEGIQMNSIKRTSTTTLPNCVDTTTTTTTTVSTSTLESTTSSIVEEVTSSSPKPPKTLKRKNKSYNLANTARPSVNNKEQDDGEDQFLALSKKFDLKEKQYKEFLMKQQSKGALDQQHRQNYDALMNDHERIMKLSQNNNQAESDEMNNNDDEESLVKLSAHTDSEGSSFIDDLIQQVDSSKINQNSQQSDTIDEPYQEFHPSETIENLSQGIVLYDALLYS
jgi:hypothetical protein